MKKEGKKYNSIKRNLKKNKAQTKKNRGKKQGGNDDLSFTPTTTIELSTKIKSNEPKNFSNWNTSNINDMASIFEKYKFENNENDNIKNWDVSNVKKMYAMFANSKTFNQSLNDWNVSKVENMDYMFEYCKSFNQPLNKGNVSEVKTMEGMFAHCEVFNQPLNKWDVSNVENMDSMFYNCKNLGKDLNEPVLSDLWISKINELKPILCFFGCPYIKRDYSDKLPWQCFTQNEQELDQDQEYDQGYESEYEEEYDSEYEPNIINYDKVVPSKISPSTILEIDTKYNDTFEIEDYSISEKIQDKNNIIFIYKKNCYLLTKEIIENVCKDENQVKYDCHGTGFTNVEKQTPYLNLRSIGIFAGILPMTKLKFILSEDNNHQLFEIKETDKEAISTASLRMFYVDKSRVDAASGSHCQEGQGARICDLFYIL